jgi:hypothetical protein
LFFRPRRAKEANTSTLNFIYLLRAKPGSVIAIILIAVPVFD